MVKVSGAPVAFNTSSAPAMTSLPMPSPGTTAMRFFGWRIRLAFCPRVVEPGGGQLAVALGGPLFDVMVGIHDGDDQLLHVLAGDVGAIHEIENQLVGIGHAAQLHARLVLAGAVMRCQELLAAIGMEHGNHL